jgi:hypothetical protein
MFSLRVQVGAEFLDGRIGTTIIRYTSPPGVAFSESIMYVNAPAD